MSIQISLFVIVIMACFKDVLAQQNREQRMKIINYNVLHGFEEDTAKMKAFAGWVKVQNPDVITFQELNGFDLGKLQALAATYDHPYAVINTGVTHPIGITSRYPITNVQRDTLTMWHSYLYGNIREVHFFVTHLSPFEVESRRADVDKIMEKARAIPGQEKVVIAGDFNALAAIDSAQYDAELLTAMRKSEGRLEPKSGLPIVKGKTIYRNNLDNGNIDYTVTGKMLRAGFMDAYYLVNKTYKHTVPTKSHQTKNAKLRRIDYIWVNKAAAGNVVAADIIHDAQTDMLSDHYPVILELKNIN